MKTLAPLCSAAEDFVVLRRCVVAGLLGQFKMRLDHVGHFPQSQLRALLAALFRDCVETGKVARLSQFSRWNQRLAQADLMYAIAILRPTTAPLAR